MREELEVEGFHLEKEQRMRNRIDKSDISDTCSSANKKKHICQISNLLGLMVTVWRSKTTRPI